MTSNTTQSTDDAERLPEGLIDLCERFDLDPPTPGERWEFTTEGEYDYDDVRRTLVSAGCDLCQNVKIEDGRRWEYVVPEPGWPDPLGYITTDEPAWVGPQHGWQGDKFYGNVRGSIPDSGDCDRHPGLPANAYALTTVHIYPPGHEAKHHAKTTLERPSGSWVVDLTYEQATASSRTFVEVYSSELGEYPECTEWRSGRASRDERRRVEYFDTRSGAASFVGERTGLVVPDHPDENPSHGGNHE